MGKHFPLPVAKEHFDRWVGLFVETVERLFTGPKAEEAKGYARSIADTFQMRMGLHELSFSTRLAVTSHG